MSTASRRSRAPRLTPVAAALLMAGSSGVLAQGTATLPEVRVTAPGVAPYKVDETSSPKATAPLAERPQTVTVIPAEVIAEQGVRTLTEALRNTPGISFNAGENGFGTGTTNFSLRGFDTSGNVFIDGARDSGNYSRDVFNLEQVEVVKGPEGDNGRGGAGGYVNMVTKSARHQQNFINANVGLGFDRYDSSMRKRATLDANRTLSDSAAFRLNLMVEDGGVAGRDRAEQSGYGIAPSLALRLGAQTDLLLSYQHLRTDDRPDWGVPAALIPGMLNHDPAAGGKSNRDVYYGLNSDFDESKSDSLLARITHRISPNVVFSNQTRWSKTDREALYTVPTGYAPATQLVTTQLQAYQRENKSLSNLSNFDLRFDTGRLKHHAAVGLELSQEESDAGRFPTNNPINPGQVSIFDPDPGRASAAFGDLSPTQTARVKVSTIALYGYDTIELNPRWKLTGGLRVERYKVSIDSRTAAGAPQGPDGFERSEVSVGSKLGLVYKPAANGSVYVSMSEAALPPGSFLSNPDISREGNNAFPGWQGQNHRDSKEQRSRHFEIGTKWELLDKRLSTTAALFHTERRNIAMGPGTTPVGYGKQQVKGIELGAAGALSPVWSVFGGLVVLDSKRSHSADIDAALSGDYGSYTTTNGDELAFTPKVTANLWTTYRFSPALTVGAGIRYVGSSWLGRPDTADRVIPNGRFGKLPSYTVVDLMASYVVNRNLTLRLNVGNVTDKLYAVSANWPGTRVLLGAPRTFLVSADLKF